VRAADALRAAAARIGGPTGRLDAEVLMAHLLRMNRSRMLLTSDLWMNEQDYEKLVSRRVGGEPVAYIIGAREFWSLDLQVTPDVLIPRPDSETLIAAALEACKTPPRRVLDLGTGSGALLLAALSEWPDASGVGIDASPAALAVAARNAERLGFAARTAFRLGDWGHGLAERFDLVLSNPPYINDDADLSVEVRDHEPAMALYAGADGLDDYHRLVPQLPAMMAEEGVAIIEIGSTQAAAVLAIAAGVGLAGTVKQDLAGLDRCVVLRTQ
jgi:release factor glutamine methyltransferase